MSGLYYRIFEGGDNHHLDHKKTYSVQTLSGVSEVVTLHTKLLTEFNVMLVKDPISLFMFNQKYHITNHNDKKLKGIFPLCISKPSDIGRYDRESNESLEKSLKDLGNINGQIVPPRNLLVGLSLIDKEFIRYNLYQKSSLGQDVYHLKDSCGSSRDVLSNFIPLIETGVRGLFDESGLHEFENTGFKEIKLTDVIRG